MVNINRYNSFTERFLTHLAWSVSDAKCSIAVSTCESPTQLLMITKDRKESKGKGKF